MESDEGVHDLTREPLPVQQNGNTSVVLGHNGAEAVTAILVVGMTVHRPVARAIPNQAPHMHWSYGPGVLVCCDASCVVIVDDLQAGHALQAVSLDESDILSRLFLGICKCLAMDVVCDIS